VLIFERYLKDLDFVLQEDGREALHHSLCMTQANHLAQFSIHSRPLSYDGSLIVTRSITLGTPIIFVSMNYRCEDSLTLHGQRHI
jgi:hypothetical protein